MNVAWSKFPPTEDGFYWCRYIDTQGVPREPDIIKLEGGRAFEFGSEHVWELQVGCFEYGPKIECSVGYA